MIKMIVIDDEALVRKGIRETINWEKYNIKIIGEANNGQKGYQLIKETNPDIVISDIKMPVMDGVQLAKKIEKEKLDLGLIILSGYQDFNFAKEALESGAFEYLLKPIDNQELIQSVLRAIERQNKKRNLESKAKVYDEQKELIENTLVYDLLTKDYKIFQSLHQQINKIKSSLPEQGYLVVINIDEKESEITGEDNISFANNYLNNLNKLNHQYYLNSFNQDLVILINTKKDDLYKYLFELIEKYETNHDSSISIGISKHYNNIVNLHERFSEAKIAVSSKLYLGFSHLLFYEDKTIDLKPIVKDVMTYIANNYHKNISVKSASEALYVSESYLLHQFKEHSHRTFNDCLSKHRVLMAKKKLLNRDKRVYEVALEVGYNDAKYFSQIFKKRVGISPTEYRKEKGIIE
ncbi:MAG: response regulator [Candidatus Izimaplasma sp.]|nr:response regulator [Candidatus Izimaplasma bacterium]